MGKINRIIELQNIEKRYQLSCHIFAKDESINPSGSIKDKTVFQMLKDYQAEGKFVEGCTIVEATSGNTGIALSYYAKEFSYHCVIVMPNNVSPQRREMIEQYGGEVILVNGGMKECHEKVEKIVKQCQKAFIFSQFESFSNPKAHFLATGPEIFETIKNVDYIFAGIGTGGTISGIGEFYKKHSPKTMIIGVEPDESPLLTKGIANSHLIQGIGANFVPSILNRIVIDEVVTVKGQDSIEMAKELNDMEDVFVGYSSGASLLAAIQYCQSHNLKNKNIVVILPDKGDRYSW